MAPEISALIEQFRGGDEDSALHGLIELPNEALPDLIEHFRAESLAPVRALLVKAIWEHREPATIPFLAEALKDNDEEVWQEALDGLVSFGSAEALAVLQAASDNRSGDAADTRRFRLWIGEAIEQIQFELRRR